MKKWMMRVQFRIQQIRNILTQFYLNPEHPDIIEFFKDHSKRKVSESESEKDNQQPNINKRNFKLFI